MSTKTEFLFFFCPTSHVSVYVTFSLYTDCPKSRFSETVLMFARNTVLFTNANLITHTSEKTAYCNKN
jgi:hypothetical protein